MITGICVSLLISLNNGVFLFPEYDGEAIPLAASIVTESRDVMNGENPVITVVVHNPGAQAVELRAIGRPIEQGIEIAFDGGPPIQIPRREVDRSTNPGGVVIGAGESIRVKTLLFSEMPPHVWPQGVRTLRISPSGTPMKVRNVGTEPWSDVIWSCTPVSLAVVEPQGREVNAVAFLQSRIAEYEEEVRRGIQGNSSTKFYVTVFLAFLDDFGGTRIAPEVEHHLAILLLSYLGNDGKLDTERERLIAAWETCASRCLDRGEPYTNGLLDWQRANGRSNAIELAITNGRLSLLSRLVSAIDAADPQDMEGQLHRRILLLATAGKTTEAAEVLREMERRFPESKQTEAASDFVERRSR